MCFSATASFTAAAFLVPAGVCSSFLALSKNKRYLFFAVIPLLFGMQQFSEGFVWLSLHSGGEGVKFWSYCFTFFAWFFWPFWLNFALYYIQPSKYTMLFALLSFLFGLISWSPAIINPEDFITHIRDGSICYVVPSGYVDNPPLLKRIIYVILGAVPMLFAKDHNVRIFSVLMLISLGAAYYFYSSTYQSVWCFFSAIISLWVIYAVKESKIQYNGQST